MTVTAPNVKDIPKTDSGTEGQSSANTSPMPPHILNARGVGTRPFTTEAFTYQDPEAPKSTTMINPENYGTGGEQKA